MSFGTTNDLVIKATWKGEDIERGLKGLDRDLDKIGRANVTPRINTRGIDGAHAATTKFSRSLGGLAKSAALILLPTAAVAGFVAATKNAVFAASDLGETLNKTRQVFRDSADPIIKWSEDAATSLGLTSTAALDGAASIGAMLIPMGLSDRQAMGMSRTMAQLASDMASFNNEDPSEMLDRIRAGLAGESEPLRRYGVDLRVAAVQQQAVKDGLAKQDEKLTGSRLVMAMYGKILADTKRQQGDFARTSGGLANQQRILNASLGELSAGFGKMLLPAVTRAVKYLNTNAVPQMRKFADQLGKVWERDDLTPEEKIKESWKRLAATGLPAKAGKAILDGFSAVVTQMPGHFIRALQEAPWPAKAVLAAVFIKKFGPALQMGAGVLSKSFGAAAGAGGVGALAGAGVSRAAPVPVFVVNQLPGGVGGALPGLAVAGKAGVIGSVAAAAAVPLLAGAGVIGAGIALNKLDDKFHFMSNDPKDYKKEVAAAQQAFIAAWRAGDTKAMQEALAKITGTSLIQTPQSLASITEEGTRVANSFTGTLRDAIVKGGPSVRRSTAGIVSDAIAGLDALPPAARLIAGRSIVSFTAKMESQGKVAKGSTKALIDAIEEEFGKLPPAIRSLVNSALTPLAIFRRNIGLIKGAATDAQAGVKHAVDLMIADAARLGNAPVSNPLAGVPVPRELRARGAPSARGRLFPGTYRGRDEFLAPLAPGEAVLTPLQQRMVENGYSIKSALRTTGGAGFAAGGVVEAASARAAGKLGTNYSYGVWDCSKFATYVAGTGSGSTAWAYPHSSPAKGGEPIVWGFMKSHSGTYRGGKDEHMGIRVDGRWFQNSSGSGVTATSNNWQEIRVPRGLENLSAAGGGDSKDDPELSVFDQTKKYLRTLGIGKGPSSKREGPGAAATARRLVSAVPDVSSGDFGGLNDRQGRIVSKAGREKYAGEKAANPTGDPAVWAAAKDKAERGQTVIFLQKTVEKKTALLNKFKRLRDGAKSDYERIAKRKTKNPADHRAKVALMRQAWVKWKKLAREVTEIRAEIQQVNESLMDIGQQAEMEGDSAAYTGDGGGSGSGSDSGSDSATNEALERDSAANAARAASSGGFLKTLIGARDIDPLAAGPTIVMPVTIQGSVVRDVELSGWLADVLSGTSPSRSGLYRSPA